MSDTVTVSRKALRQLLKALQGPGHLIRELQVTQGLGENPIDDLLDAVDRQASSDDVDLTGDRADTVIFKILHKYKRRVASFGVWIDSSTGDLKAYVVCRDSKVIMSAPCPALADALKNLYREMEKELG